MKKELVPSKDFINFGEIEKNKVVETTITLFNHSEETLKLTPWRSCGCTTPILYSIIVEPENSTDMKIIFNSKGKSGLQEKSVGVNYYLNGKTKELRINFKVKIKK